MFKCMDCGCEFEEPAVSREYHGLEYGYEERYSCPNCGGPDYKDSQPCDICGDYAWESCFCKNCREEAKDMLKIDLNHFIPQARMSDIIDLFTEALDELYVEERSKAK